MLDVLFTDGLIVDGTGRPARRGSVGVRDGRIVAVGDRPDEPASRTVDLDGSVICPGFIDLHTHYDAQIMWDGAATPSCFHGVTSIFGGNCGFTVAPLDDATAEYIVPMLARVEGMSPEALSAGLDLAWSSFGEWLGRIEGTTALNTGFLVGHSTLRRKVMGERAVGESATPAELEAMRALLDQSLGEGAYGFSSSWAESHTDHNGDPVPSRSATREELLELGRAAGSHGGAMLEFIPSAAPRFDEAANEILASLAAASGRPVNWNLLHVRPGEEERLNRESRLAATDLAARRGASVVALMLPRSEPQRATFASGFLYGLLPGWEDLFKLSLADRSRVLGDPAERTRLAAQAASFGYRTWTDWAHCSVSDVADPALAHLVGRTFGELAAERGTSAFDALLDVVLADGLLTGVETHALGNDDQECWETRQQLLRDGRVVVGGSDAGAHLDMVQSFAYPTRLLTEMVRDRELLGLEEAVRLITSVPADLYGVSGRGRIAPGHFADLVVFDLDELGVDDIRMTADLPGGAERLTAGSTGFRSVWVNGVQVVDGSSLTGHTPGHLLRRGGGDR